MKLIIAGSRTIQVSPEHLKKFLDRYMIWPTEVVSGGAKGMDQSGEFFAQDFEIKITRFPADWDTHGKMAGPIRNKQMAEYADALVLIWDGQSKGSMNMRKTMLSLNKPIYEVILKGAK